MSLKCQISIKGNNVLHATRRIIDFQSLTNERANINVVCTASLIHFVTTQIYKQNNGGRCRQINPH